MSSDYDPEMLSVGVLGRPHGVARRDRACARTTRRAARWTRPERAGRAGRRPAPALRRRGDATGRGRLPGALGRRRRSRGGRGADAGARCGCRARALPPLAPGEFYVEDVVGCAVEDEDGRPLGVVRGDVLERRARRRRAWTAPTAASGSSRSSPTSCSTSTPPARKMRVRWSDDELKPSRRASPSSS